MNLEKKALSGYLQRKKLIVRGTPIRVQTLGDSTKNRVYYVSSRSQSWIIKQSFARTQTKDRWSIDRKRVSTEVNCIEVLRQFLPPEVIPEPIVEDRTDYISITTAPPKNAVLWESELAEGKIDLQIASQCGELLATVHNETRDQSQIKALFKDTKAFEQLRIEPNHDHVVKNFPDLNKGIKAQTKRLKKDGYCLVLGDLRPRNVWINGGQLYLVDFATAHYGHPSFDLGFYAADMCVKAIQNSLQKAAYLEAINVFWKGYFDLSFSKKKPEEIEKPAVRDLGCMLLAATDGRNPVYFEDPPVTDLTRRIAMSLLFTELNSIEEITEFINRTLIDG